MKYLYSKRVRVWLIIGLIMIFFQVVIGGVTRLTGSGLSITKWEIVTGSIPPMGAEQWEEAFDLYKDSPQYQKINRGMSLPEFKFIYFWEYFHRLWARSMGFVFLIPFIIFWRRKKIDKPLMRKLGSVVGLAALAASFGWIMVASGLSDRPWVNAYKLSLHLAIAFSVFVALELATIYSYIGTKKFIHNLVLTKWTKWFLAILVVQILLGGLMSGMKAALVYPTWPDMAGGLIPPILYDGRAWAVENLVNYDTNLFTPSLVQFCHRITAYVLIIIGLWMFIKFKKQLKNRFAGIVFVLWVSIIIIQIILGILTLINSKGSIPVDLGVYHQAGAILLLAMTILFLKLQGRDKITDDLWCG